MRFGVIFCSGTQYPLWFWFRYLLHHSVGRELSQLSQMFTAKNSCKQHQHGFRISLKPKTGTTQLHGTGFNYKLYYLKGRYTFRNCQRPVFSLRVSQHKHKITSLWKFELNWSSKLRENDERKNTLVLSDRNKILLARSILLF